MGSLREALCDNCTATREYVKKKVFFHCKLCGFPKERRKVFKKRVLRG